MNFPHQRHVARFLIRLHIQRGIFIPMSLLPSLLSRGPVDSQGQGLTLHAVRDHAYSLRRPQVTNGRSLSFCYHFFICALLYHLRIFDPFLTIYQVVGEEGGHHALVTVAHSFIPSASHLLKESQGRASFS